MKLDRVDNQLLAALQRDGRASNRELAELVHLSESACLRRIRALEQAGVIDRYAALVNQAKVGLPGNVFVSITLMRRIGAVRAYARVRSVAKGASLNLLWALEGALTGKPWQQVAKEHRLSLLLALEAMDDDTQGEGGQG